MSSPYIRRRQLAAEIRKIREQRNLTCDDLAGLVFHSRTKITRLENAQTRPDLAEIVKMLEALEITGAKYDRIFNLAREAAEKGWWDRYGMSMGPRQKLYADLESGAASIRVFDQTAMPVVLQTPQFVSALVDIDRRRGKLNYRPERMAEAREQRRRHLLRSGGPSYDTVIDECIIHRLDVPVDIMAAQLRHVVQTANDLGQVTVRLLRWNARLPDCFLPRTSFYLFTFPDRSDPPMAALDTVSADLLLTKKQEVAEYSELYARLRASALSPDESVRFLDRLADTFAEAAGSKA